MYNRYIPRDDGSYTRNRMAESKAPDPPVPSPASPPNPKQECTSSIPVPPKIGPGIGDFFRNLLPRKMETEDLIILLLLLLMAGQRQEEQNNALLTMALYFLL